jgi:hypothetical protein
MDANFLRMFCAFFFSRGERAMTAAAKTDDGQEAKVAVLLF